MEIVKKKYNDNYCESGLTRREAMIERLHKAGEVEKGLKSGLPLDSALALAKLSPIRWRDWVAEGEAQTSVSGDMRWIVGLVGVCESKFQKNLLDEIIEKAKKDWKAAAWLLERRFRREWGNELPQIETDKNATVIFTAAIGTDGTIRRNTDTDTTLQLIRNATDSTMHAQSDEFK